MLAIVILSLTIIGCKTKTADQHQHRLKQTFIDNARDNNLPSELMLATGYVESRLSVSNSIVVYNDRQAVGSRIGESVFGLSRDRLQPFVGEQENVSDFTVQIKAYARLLRAHIDDNGLDLSAEPQRAEELVAWIWQLAKVHRHGDDFKNNARSLFALEVLNVLNEGFEWQDPNSGEQIILLPRQVDRQELPAPQRHLLTLRTAEAQLYRAQWLPAVEPIVGDQKNTPKSIVIMHCPFTLSACLELQNRDVVEGEVVLQAHYLIPANGQVIDYPIQVTHHEKMVTVTDRNGQPEIQTDKIVIMLAGNSGRVNNNVRFPADATWQDGFQLEWLSYMIEELCSNHLGLPDADSIEKCRDPFSPARRIDFRVKDEPRTFANHRWGDIPDFDKSIYAAYLQKPQRFQTTLTTSDDRQHFASGELITLLFPSNGRNYYVLEKLVRCHESQRLVWVAVSQGESATTGHQQFQIKFYDSGTNNDGRQFLRAKAFSGETLVSWAMTSLYVYGYDNEREDKVYYRDCDTR